MKRCRLAVRGVDDREPEVVAALVVGAVEVVLVLVVGTAGAATLVTGVDEEFAVWLPWLPPHPASKAAANGNAQRWRRGR
jgi:hypothetical protein